MTDTTASNPVPESHGHEARTHSAATSQADGASSDPWQVVTFPGQMPIAENVSENFSATLEASVPVSPSPPPAASAPTPKPSLPDTAELIQLIQDLNHCNDALLLRVSDLEESLECSQAALQAEVERNQASSPGSAATAMPQPPVVPQQIAQLLTELEIANDGLRRATIHNETLQTELESSQQRVAQLERECTLLQQRFSEKSTALQQAEASCSDLKARLQRQQRYTLQFKTALEKYLNMAGEPSSVGAAFAPTIADATQPVGMPKAPEIQPWSTSESAAQGGNLASLLNGLKGNRSAESSPAPSPLPAVALEATMAERDPWSRPVVDPPAAIASPPMVSPSRPAPVEVSQPLPDHQPTVADLWPTPPEAESVAEFTEPSPWGAPLNQPAVTPAPVAASPAAMSLEESAPLANQARPSTEDSSMVDISVPSEQALPAAVSTSQPAPTAPPRPDVSSLPAYLQPEVEAVPSPKVYPRRTPKKIGSLAAVQLPSFGRSPRRS